MNRLFVKYLCIIFFSSCLSSFANDDISNLLNISDNNEQFYVIGETEKINLEITDLLPNKTKKQNDKTNTNLTKHPTDVKNKEQKITKIDGTLDIPPKPENLVILNDEFNLTNNDDISKLKSVILANSLNKTDYIKNKEQKSIKTSKSKTITLDDLKNEREKLEQMKLKLIDMQKANYIQRDVSSSKVLTGKDFKKF